MRIIFMGTPDFAVPALQALHAAGHQILAAYTQPPRPGGRRGKELTPTPVHKAAEALGIEVRHPVTLKDAQAQADFAALDADVAVVAAYGLILPQSVLDMPRHGCLNIHASLLPRWRGAAPVQRAILAGDGETGITIMQMAAGLDTGAMLAKVATPVDRRTTGELTSELAASGAGLMVEVLADLPAFPPEEQDDALATYAAKIDKAEARIDFTKGALQVDRQVRAFAPAPGAWFEVDGERVKVLAAELAPNSHYSPEAGVTLDDQLTIGCGDSAIRPIVVQRAGKPAMNTADLLRGFPIPAGTQLG
ncbi:methionyl-tRNA formyltransferase [Altererythrobacter sp. CC-YST694]|uniref:methionyl-tRNA formyltransferase n=1 Tax=Altererythrobacter sp. CC-YST694 TaxID=2755038 RepID=UPI001D015CDB|nr:methionyl-tRNA formyltransferase [Altererythrobacter sp. CC-YST694]MCB5424895.1 methionyl-tRNA formyltransferase [Altererythrobacter sp. CC-YST694]